MFDLRRVCNLVGVERQAKVRLDLLSQHAVAVVGVVRSNDLAGAFGSGCLGLWRQQSSKRVVGFLGLGFKEAEGHLAQRYLGTLWHFVVKIIFGRFSGGLQTGKEGLAEELPGELRHINRVWLCCLVGFGLFQRGETKGGGD